MITYIGEWITHIVLLVLIATFLDLIVPNTSMKKYVKLVVGLLIMMVVLTPVLDLFQLDHEQFVRSVDALPTNEERSRQMDQAFEMQLQEVEGEQREAILQEVNSRWAQQMRLDLTHEHDIPVQDVKLSFDMEGEQVQIDQVHLVFNSSLDGPDEEGNAARADGPDENGGVPDRNTDVKVEPVKPVNVRVNRISGAEDGQSAEENIPDKIKERVLTYLLDEWNISVDKITFSWQTEER